MKEIENEIQNESHFFRTLFFLLLLAIILIFIYGKFLGNSGVISKEYNLQNDNFPESFNTLKIAHFSDILYKNEEDLEKFDLLIEKINDKKPDIIIFTGNLTKEKYNFEEEETNKIKEKLSKLTCTYGKYYVSGKNDKSNPSYDSIMQSSGFISLNDNKDIIYSKLKEKILLVGLDNNSSIGFISDILKDNTFKYKMVMFSESDEIDDIKDYSFDIAFSSNSLNGQINIPIIKRFFVREGSTKYIEPYYKVDNTDLYISSGIGTDKYDYRLFNKPSFNFYKIKK